MVVKNNNHIMRIVFKIQRIYLLNPDELLGWPDVRYLADLTAS